MLETFGILAIGYLVLLTASEKYSDMEIERLRKELASLNFPRERMLGFDIIKRMRILQVNNRQEVYEKYRHCLRDWEIDELKASGKIATTTSVAAQAMGFTDNIAETEKAPMNSLVAHKIIEKHRKGIALSAAEYEFLCMYDEDLTRRRLLAEEREATKMKKVTVTEEDPCFETAIENWESGKELTDEEEEILSETEEFDDLDDEDEEFDDDWDDLDDKGDDKDDFEIEFFITPEEEFGMEGIDYDENTPKGYH